MFTKRRFGIALLCLGLLVAGGFLRTPFSSIASLVAYATVADDAMPNVKRCLANWAPPDFCIYTDQNDYAEADGRPFAHRFVVRADVGRSENRGEVQARIAKAITVAWAGDARNVHHNEKGCRVRDHAEYHYPALGHNRFVLFHTVDCPAFDPKLAVELEGEGDMVCPPGYDLRPDPNAPRGYDGPGYAPRSGRGSQDHSI